MRVIVMLFLLGCLQPAFANIGENFNARVINVIDGNTLEVQNPDKQVEKIVLAGIDSPEPGQEFSNEAKELLEKLLLDKEVMVKIEGKDRKGNYLGVVTLAKNDLDPRFELLKAGLAWTAEKDPSPDLEAHRVKAVEKGKGIWTLENPVPPWTYRRQQSMLRPKGS